MKTELPSIKAEIKAAELKRIKAERLEADKKLRGHMQRTFGTADGLAVLKWIHDQCGHNQPVLGAANGQINSEITVYNAMRLGLYLEIRKHLTIKQLKEVEF